MGSWWGINLSDGFTIFQLISCSLIFLDNEYLFIMNDDINKYQLYSKKECVQIYTTRINTCYQHTKNSRTTTIKKVYKSMR